MKITFLTLFPELIRNYLEDAFLKKASSNGLMNFEVISLRDFSDNTYRSVDDKPYGGGDGMILRPDIAEKCFNSITTKPNTLRLYVSPQGQKLDQNFLKKILQYEQLVILNGRYGGVDQRVINQFIDEEVSIGDFVLSGGELASLVLAEALSRMIPGVVGDYKSVQEDSHFNGLLECPQFTKPTQVELNQSCVPQILLSGHHEKIRHWKFSVSLMTTWKKRPDLFSQYLKVNRDHLDLFQQKKMIQDLTTEELISLGFSSDDQNAYLHELNLKVKSDSL